jgi:HK97 family phage prohead protease
MINSPAGPVISGYAIVFNKWSQDLGGFKEIIEPGAVSRANNFHGVVSIFNHDANYILGRVPDTMKVTVDDYGVRFDVTVPDTAFGNMVRTAVERGDVNGCSFGFTIAADGDSWTKNKAGLWERTIKRFAKIYDLSPVVFPAYLDTSVSINPDELAKRQADELKKQSEAVRKVRYQLHIAELMMKK